MKTTSRLPVIVLALAVVVLVVVLPVRMMASSAMQHRDDAAALNEETEQIEQRVRRAEAAKANEAELSASLKKIRATLPNVPDQYIAPIIRMIGDRAAARNVSVTAQSEESPIPAPTTGDGTDTAAAADPSANPAAPKAFTVSITVKGTSADVLGFIGDLPGTERLYFESVQLSGDPEDAGFTASGADVVKVNLSLKAYVAANATATGS